jgi:hypothetical protein
MAALDQARRRHCKNDRSLQHPQTESSAPTHS